MRLALALWVLALAAPAAAQALPSPAPPASPAPPTSAPPATFTPFVAPSHAVISAFEARFLSVDPATGAATRGSAHTPVAPEAFFEEVGRADLADRYRSTRKLKRVLYGVGAAVAVGGLTAGVVELATQPDLNTSPCTDVTVFNTRCEPEAHRKQELGAGLIASGLAVGAILALVSYRLDPMPVSPPEARGLANGYNTSLWRKLRGEPVGLAPAVGPNQVGLVLHGGF